MQKYLTSLLLTGAIVSGVAHGASYGEKIYATTTAVTDHVGFAMFEGKNYYLPAIPGDGWAISNANGTEAPHWLFVGSANMTSQAIDGPGTAVQAGKTIERQLTPSYINVYDAPNCVQFDGQVFPVELGECYYNVGAVAWSSLYIPSSVTGFILQVYNGGCGGGGSICTDWVSTLLQWNGCYNPSRVFCSMSAINCLACT